MVINANDETEYVNDEDLIPCVQATGEKIKTEERLKAELTVHVIVTGKHLRHAEIFFLLCLQ